MSGFDPSVLERKDRDELSQIAESLGQKPPSRARKADIVDLILRLAGVGADAAAGSGNGAAVGEEPAVESPARPAPNNGGASPAGRKVAPGGTARTNAGARAPGPGRDVPARGQPQL